jgi:hypothetical protein
MDESPAELVVDTEKLSVEPPPSNGSQPTPEELAAKAIAPVKKEFLRPPPLPVFKTTPFPKLKSFPSRRRNPNASSNVNAIRSSLCLSLSLSLHIYIYLYVCVCVSSF